MTNFQLKYELSVVRQQNNTTFSQRRFPQNNTTFSQFQNYL